MADLQSRAPLALKTSSIGWPVELNIYKIRDDVYVKKHGFSFIDKFLSENGKLPSPFA